MVWAIIGVVLVLAIGPLFWLRPSRRERGVAALREEARKANLTVEVARLPDLDAAPEARVSAGGRARAPTIECATYRLLAPGRLEAAPHWRLLKSARENRYLEGWTTLEPPRALPAPQADYWRRVAAIVDTLPGGCLAVEATADGVGWSGRERLGDASPETVAAAIRGGLEALRDLHQELADGGAAG